MSNLALLYEWRERFDDAETLHERVLDIYTKLPNLRDDRIAMALSNLGRGYLKHGRQANDTAQFEAAAPGPIR